MQNEETIHPNSPICVALTAFNAVDGVDERQSKAITALCRSTRFERFPGPHELSLSSSHLQSHLQLVTLNDFPHFESMHIYIPFRVRIYR